MLSRAKIVQLIALHGRNGSLVVFFFLTSFFFVAWRQQYAKQIGYRPILAQRSMSTGVDPPYRGRPCSLSLGVRRSRLRSRDRLGLSSLGIERAESMTPEVGWCLWLPTVQLNPHAIME